MSINKIAVYQGGRWVTEDIGVQSSKIVGNIQSSQINSLDSSKITGSIQSSQIENIANTKITGLTNNSQAAVLAAVATNDHLYVPTNPVFHTHLTGLTSNVQTQIDGLSESITSLATSAKLHASDDGFSPFYNMYYLYIPQDTTKSFRIYSPIEYSSTSTNASKDGYSNTNCKIIYFWFSNNSSKSDIGTVSWTGTNTAHDAITRLNTSPASSSNIQIRSRADSSAGRFYREATFHAGNAAAYVYIMPVQIDNAHLANGLVYGVYG